MQFYRCRCGNRQSYGSMGPYPCLRCEECGSNLAQSPELHREPLEHDFSSIQEVETDAGPAQLTRCCYCHQTRKEVAEGKF